MDKYLMSKAWLEKLVPNLRLCDLNRITYQQLLNDYAVHHERQTTMDFHHQLKGAIQDAVDDGLITKDPTRKAIIKGKIATHAAAAAPFRSLPPAEKYCEIINVRVYILGFCKIYKLYAYSFHMATPFNITMVTVTGFS